ncbi:MAG: peptide deformylase [Bacillota bacterium]
MAVYKILEVGDDILRTKAKEVVNFNDSIKRLLRNMEDTMYDADGVGLAAPQIGVSKRVIIVDVGDGLIELINPVIEQFEGEEEDQEGCLSVPGRQGIVKRAASVKVSALDRAGNNIVIDAEGLLARALQHEIDHLEGILFIDKLVAEVQGGD